MVFKDFCVIVLWTKVASALKGLGQFPNKHELLAVFRIRILKAQPGNCPSQFPVSVCGSICMSIACQHASREYLSRIDL